MMGSVIVGGFLIAVGAVNVLIGLAALAREVFLPSSEYRELVQGTGLVQVVRDVLEALAKLLDSLAGLLAVLERWPSSSRRIFLGLVVELIGLGFVGGGITLVTLSPF